MVGMYGSTGKAAGRTAVAAIRITGLVLVTLITLYGAAARADGDIATTVGVLVLAGFLWLTVSGAFGYGAVCPGDWVGLVPFCIALVVREIFVLPSVEELYLHFVQGPVDRHSVVYPLLQMWFVPIVPDVQSFVMHMNGVLGALASLSAYLFVRQRLDSRSAGFLSALFLATHPLVARFSPTDGPYGLLLAAWFSGLVLLSVRELNARALFGGAALVGIAATTRIEGAVLLIASAVMLDVRALIGAARRHRITAVCAFLVVYVLIAVQMSLLFPEYASGRMGAPSLRPVLLPSVGWVLRDAVWPAAYDDHLFMGLVWVGALAGIARRFRLGLWAYLASVLMLIPVVRSGAFPPALHRIIPVCAVQAIVAGIGAAALTAWIPSSSRWRWCAVIPGAIAAFFVLARQQEVLTRRYVFNEEYDLVRSHLAPGGSSVSDCVLLSFSADFAGDVGLHDFGQVVPGTPVRDCRRDDCIAQAANGGCLYYIRSAACYYREAGVPPECAAAGAPVAGDRRTCLNEACASFERAVELQAIDVRTVDLHGTFPDRVANYPEKAEIGLFRVRPRQRQ